jgi:hypothetical protein
MNGWEVLADQVMIQDACAKQALRLTLNPNSPSNPKPLDQVMIQDACATMRQIDLFVRQIDLFVV